jgi:XisI protein
MDQQIDHYRQIIRDVLTSLTVIPYSFGEIAIERVFDPETDHYMIVNAGFDRQGRVYGPIAHIDLIDGKCWIQRDGTEEGLAGMLLDAGVAKEHIVLAFYQPSFRQFTEFAVS